MLTLTSIRSQSLTGKNYDQEPDCFNYSMKSDIRAKKNMQHNPKEP